MDRGLIEEVVADSDFYASSGCNIAMENSQETILVLHLRVLDELRACYFS